MPVIVIRKCSICKTFYFGSVINGGEEAALWEETENRKKDGNENRP